jgi:hypothetical protein
MTTYLLNALPNSLLVPEAGQSTVIEGITVEQAYDLLSNGFTSAVGHDSTAELLTRKIGLTVEKNRITVTPQKGDVLVVGAFVSPRRLAEGELYTEAEILTLEVKFCKITL